MKRPTLWCSLPVISRRRKRWSGQLEKDLQESTLESPKGLASYKDMADAAAYVELWPLIWKLLSAWLEAGRQFWLHTYFRRSDQGAALWDFYDLSRRELHSKFAYAPFLQIGETKYGKPILDRVIKNNTSLEEAARCALVSLDSTMRSNLP